MSSDFLKKMVLNLGIIGFLLTGCHQIYQKSNIEPPTKLVPLTYSFHILREIYNNKIGSRYGNKNTLQLIPAFNGSLVFTASTDGKVQASTIQSSFVNGMRLWEVDIQDEITGGVAYDHNTYTVIITAKSGKVIALDGRSGKLKWKRQLSGSVLTPAVISSDKNKVMLSANDGILYGLDLKNGDIVWKFTTSVPVINIRGTAKPILLDEDKILFPVANGNIYSVSVSNGAFLNLYQVGLATSNNDIGNMTDIDSSVVIDKNELFTTSYSGQLVNINLVNQKETSFAKISSIHQPLVSNDLVVVSGLNGDIVAFDRYTGQEKWHNVQLKFRRLTNPVLVSNKYIAVGDIGGIIHLLHRDTGEIVSREKADGSLYHLQVIGNTLTTQSNSGNVVIWQWSSY